MIYLIISCTIVRFKTTDYIVLQCRNNQKLYLSIAYMRKKYDDIIELLFGLNAK